MLIVITCKFWTWDILMGSNSYLGYSEEECSCVKYKDDELLRQRTGSSKVPKTKQIFHNFAQVLQMERLHLPFASSGPCFQILEHIWTVVALTFCGIMV